MQDINLNVEEILTKAAAKRERGDRSEELILLERALTLAPADPRVLNARGMYALAIGDARLAQTCFADATKYDTSQTALWMNLATACRALENNDEEHDSLARVLAIDRRHFMAQLRMAELHQRRGAMAEAAQSWSNIVQMASGVPDRPLAVSDALDRGMTFLAGHNAEISTAIYDTLGAQLQAIGPAGRRFVACVDHSFGQRPIYQNRCAGVYFPFLPAEEFFERSAFPWLKLIESRTAEITAEAQNILAMRQESIRPYVQMETGLPENKWSQLDNSLDWGACFLWQFGVRNDELCALCPVTTEALESIPRSEIAGKAPSAFFSILKPQTHIPPHTGVTNTRAIIHLPLVIPQGCRIRVGGETREWQVGSALAFDDTIEHEVWNDSNEERIVLIFDVWNPNITPIEQNLIKELYALSTSAH